MIYLLTDDDIQNVKQSVQLRIDESAKQGLNHATTYNRSMETRIREESVGVAAEIAWAKLRNKQWHNPINEFHDIPDDGVHEIRATDHPNGGLIVRGNDPLQRKYILAKVSGRQVLFAGWAYGREVRIKKYEWNPHGFRQAWRMPRRDLHPMSTLESTN